MNGKRVVFGAITISVGIGLALVAGELLVRFVRPQPYMYPKFKFSDKYGIRLYENERMVDGLPRLYEYFYTTNEYGFRGKMILPEAVDGRYSVVVLGDSYSFGKGVNDGEEYSSVMRQKLGPDSIVTNISVMGWGLTQEIRAFYEYGLLYMPKVVILQFCENDPFDNLSSPVTEYENNKFIFKNTGEISSPKIQGFLSRSLILKSQLFNFIRLKVIIPFFESLHHETAIGKTDLKAQNVSDINKQLITNCDTIPTLAQKRYSDLLVPFAKDLKNRKISLIMISVNGELDRYPFIVHTVKLMERERILKYIEVRSWFEGVDNYTSPEGHVWGTKGHKIIGENLVEILRDNY
jgi:hypothetical protein